MFQVPTKAAGSRRCNQNFVGVCCEDPAGAWFYGCRAWAATIYAPTFLLCPSGVFALSSNQSKAFAAELLLCKSAAHYPSFPRYLSCSKYLLKRQGLAVVPQTLLAFAAKTQPGLGFMVVGLGQPPFMHRLFYCLQAGFSP
jgi:hypothetical protein